MITLLINVLILLLVVSLAYWIVTLIPLPPPFHLIAQVGFAIIALVVLIGLLTGQVPLMALR